MRPDPAGFELLRLGSLEEVLALLADRPGVYRPFAGGTDVMVLLSAGKLDQRRYVDLWGLEGLRGIEVSESALWLGALTTYTEVQAHPLLRAEFPMLCQAGSETGGRAIQNRGTLGGNIANASPAADSSPVLLAYGAEVELRSARSTRLVPYSEFHVGYKQTVLARDEIISRIRLPRTGAPRFHYFRKVGPRRAQAISKVCLAACAEHGGAAIASLRLAIGGVAPTVLRCPRTEGAIRDVLGGHADVEAARASLQAEISPIDDVRSTARYRRSVSLNLLGELLHRLSEWSCGQGSPAADHLRRSAP